MISITDRRSDIRYRLQHRLAVSSNESSAPDIIKFLSIFSLNLKSVRAVKSKISLKGPSAFLALTMASYKGFEIPLIIEKPSNIPSSLVFCHRD